MVVGGLSQREFAVNIVTGEFLLKGELHFRGVVSVSLNNEAVDVMPVYKARVYALDKSNVAAKMHTEELVLVRQACQFIVFDEMLSQEDFQMRTNKHPAIVYTSRFALQGNLMLGASDRFVDAVDNLKGFFLPVVDVSLYSLFPLRPEMPRKAPLVLVHRDHVKMFQEKEEKEP